MWRGTRLCPGGCTFKSRLSPRHVPGTKNNLILFLILSINLGFIFLFHFSSLSVASFMNQRTSSQKPRRILRTLRHWTHFTFPVFNILLVKIDFYIMLSYWTFSWAFIFIVFLSVNLGSLCPLPRQSSFSWKNTQGNCSPRPCCWELLVIICSSVISRLYQTNALALRHIKFVLKFVY
jgi:hypothetical protein